MGGQPVTAVMKCGPTTTLLGMLSTGFMAWSARNGP